MSTDLTLPRLGQGMESGTIVRWLKQEGETVRKGEPLYELDTDKVTQEVESDADGTLVQILVAEGEVDVGTKIAVFEANGAEAPAAAEESPAAQDEEAGADEAQQASKEAPTPAAEEEEQDPPTEPVSRVRVKASPLARRIARERGVDLASVTGTGPDERVVAEDVERAAASGVATPGAPATDGAPEVVELTSIRRTIARRLTEAWSAPVFQLGVSADMTEALALRERLVAALAEGDAKPTVNDVLVKLVAVSLARHPAVNATFTGDEIHRFSSANVGIAVAAPAGLMVPVIRSAERLTIQEIARARADLVGRARDGKLTLQDLEGGTFSVSNLGMYGVEQFVAVLNPPQVAILAVGTVVDRAVVVDREIDIAPTASFTLTCDHRAIDGADGAEFLQTFVDLVEHPALAL
jgi:pyruvate dehydrogenase E2 component (dihydrolipoamide acetyltransferase)